MASGDGLSRFPASAGIPPSANFAPISRRNNHLVALFDAAADESLDFSDVLSADYAGGGFTVTIEWMADTATSGNVVWNAQFERRRVEHADFDADTDSFAAVQAVTDTAPGTNAGRVAQAVITFTDGAQIDSLAVDEGFRLRITRNADDGADTMAGDAQLLTVRLKET